MTTKVTSRVLADTAVTTGTYGAATQHAVITVDQQGRVTYAANVAPSIANTQITGTITGAQLGVGAAVTNLGFTPYNIPAGVIVMWSGSIVSIPSGWVLCNGTSGTPDLRNRFVVGAGSTYAVAATGGSADAIVVSHTHTGTTDNTDVNHTHYFSGTTGGMNANNPHAHTYPGHLNGGGGNPGGDLNGLDNYGYRTYGEDINHGHDYSGNTGYSNQSVNHSHTFTTASSGSSGTNANLPPYYALAYIMKT
jgi:hypothetical protein